NSYMAVTGALTDEIENKVIDTFKEWPLRTIEEKNIKNEFNQSSKRFFVMYKKDLVQSEIRVSMPLFARNHPDYLKMKIINEILGGGFVSRLNTKIRAQMGLTYSISSGTDYRKDLGTLDISTFTKTKSTFAMIEQIEKELQRLVQSGITKKELIASKNLLMGQFPRALETVDSLAFNLMYLDFNGIPFSYLTDYYKNLSKISVDDVNTAIKKYFDLGKVKYFILSDNKNRAQLKGLDPVVINP
ncbi:MAG: insulinase family protein, partial [Bdellovibrionales bacterium]|nr:insulinase family protein [Bdellovibrionales bacterium]